MKKSTTEYLVMPGAIIPVANISHLLWPSDATLHVFLKNGTDLQFRKFEEQQWVELQKKFQANES